MLNDPVLQALRQAGADPNTRGKDGVSRLYGAAAGGHVEEVRFLLESRVDPSILTDYGWAPLHWAAHNGKLECVRLLLEAGANVNQMSDTSKTPLDMARVNQQSLIANILVVAGAKTAQEVYLTRSAVKTEDATETTTTTDDCDEDHDSDSSEAPEFMDVEIVTFLKICLAISNMAESKTEIDQMTKQGVAGWISWQLQVAEDTLEDESLEVSFQRLKIETRENWQQVREELKKRSIEWQEQMKSKMSESDWFWDIIFFDDFDDMAWSSENSSQAG